MPNHYTAYQPHPELELAAPPCFPLAQWDIWVKGEKRMARTANFAFQVDGYCAQCTPEYRDRMKEQGLCNHPHVEFFPDEDGDLIGRRPQTDDFGNLCYTGIPIAKEKRA